MLANVTDITSPAADCTYPGEVGLWYRTTLFFERKLLYVAPLLAGLLENHWFLHNNALLGKP
jgi:hypothetical protein